MIPASEGGMEYSAIQAHKLLIGLHVVPIGMAIFVVL